MVDKLLHGLEYASAYIDYTIVFSSNREDHLSHLKAVLGRMQHTWLTKKRKVLVHDARVCAPVSLSGEWASATRGGQREGYQGNLQSRRQNDMSDHS